MNSNVPLGVDAVHCIGIGGSGLSGLAKILLKRGVRVTGSDASDGPALDELERLGARVARDQRKENLPEDARLVVLSAAVKPENEELAEATRRGLPCLKYAQAVGMLMTGKDGIAIAGTHGKTTTTAMVAQCLIAARLDPTYLLGGVIPIIGGSSRSGEGRHFVVEACEYDRSFLNLTPLVAVVTNVEADHLDYYRDIDEIVEAFRTFASRVRPEGVAIGCGDEARVRDALEGAVSATATYGFTERNRWRAVEVDLDPGRGEPRFAVALDGEVVARVRLKVPGRHNVLNALAAIAAAASVGVEPERAAATLADFPGVNRRFQLLGEARGVRVIDDYAHHPTEVLSVLRAARDRYAGARLFAVFQPHQHSRTRDLLEHFAAVLTGFDRAIVPEIYYSRDPEALRQAVSAKDLVAAARSIGADAEHAPTLEDAVARLAREVREGDIVITMGAGDVWRVARGLLARLSAAPEPAAAGATAV